VHQVATGTQIVRKAGITIEDIVTSSQHVNQLLGQVAAGAEEQNQGISQIGKAVHELDRTTQQNAALVEETAAAAAAMQQQAHALVDEVARFKIPASVLEAMARIESELENATIPTDFDFDKAIEAHRQWKVKLRTAIAKHETLDAETICRDDKCPLGQWIHGAGGARWGSRPLFSKLLAKHAEFHQSAGAVARKINGGEYTDAKKLIDSGSQFADISVEVTTLLTTAKRGL
jgi:methyl-accepting chemotaxis protein